jgi:hypothetical protein
MNGIRKGFKPQTLLLRDKEGNTVNYKEMVKQSWYEYYEKQFELQDEQTMTVEKSGQHMYKLQNDMLNHQMV